MTDSGGEKGGDSVGVEGMNGRDMLGSAMNLKFIYILEIERRHILQVLL
jgi:hypothetical protein